MPLDECDETRQREKKFKTDAFAGAESERERQILHEHWMFDNFDESEYS